MPNPAAPVDANSLNMGFGLAPDGTAAISRIADPAVIGTTTQSGPLFVAEAPSTTLGTTPYSALSTAAVLAPLLKGSAGKVYSLQCFNVGAAAVFIRIYNHIDAPGTGDAADIVWRGIIPGLSTGAGHVVNFPTGLTCGTGIGIRVSGAVADNDATALAANEVTVNVQYK